MFCGSFTGIKFHSVLVRFTFNRYNRYNPKTQNTLQQDFVRWKFPPEQWTKFFSLGWSKEVDFDFPSEFYFISQMNVFLKLHVIYVFLCNFSLSNNYFDVRKTIPCQKFYIALPPRGWFFIRIRRGTGTSVYLLGLFVLHNGQIAFKLTLKVCFYANTFPKGVDLILMSFI